MPSWRLSVAMAHGIIPEVDMPLTAPARHYQRIAYDEVQAINQEDAQESNWKVVPQLLVNPFPVH
jgi:hypothetical protein